MTITANNLALEEQENVIGELEKLMSKSGNLTDRENKRFAFLLAKQAKLRDGAKVSELRLWEQSRLLAEAGMPKLPAKAESAMPPEVAEEWRAFALGKEVRTSFVRGDKEARANVSGTQSISYTEELPGGSFVPEGLFQRIWNTEKQYDDLFSPQFCNVYQTDTGANTALPVTDDVNSASTIVSETVQSNEVDVASFGSRQLGAFTFRSGVIAISNELMQDSGWPIGQVLELVIARRHARGIAPYLVTGTGVNQPTGLITGAIAAGCTIVVASGSATNDGSGATGATSVGTNDLNKAYYSLNAAYRPGACWAMSDSTLLAISELLDKNGRPLISFRRGITDVDGDVPHLLGKPVGICPSFPNMASGNNSIAFYYPLFFVHRMCPGFEHLRIFKQSVNLATWDLTGFQGYSRRDSALMAPNSSYVPAVIIQSHS